MQPRKILITGLTGSGGSYLAEYLLERTAGLQISGIGRSSNSPHLQKIQNRVQLFATDMRNLPAVEHAISTVRPDLIFNLASSAAVAKSFENPHEIMLGNIECTLNLLEALKRHHRECLVVHCSTSEVYGQVDAEQVPIKEDTRLSPINPYSISKLAQEHLCSVYSLSYGIPYILTRAFTYINPRRADLFSTSFARQIARIEAGLQKEITHGNLTSKRCLMDVRDVVEAYWLVALKGQPGEAYNVGSTNEISVGEVLEKLIQRSRASIPTRTDPQLLRPTDVTNQIPNITKLQAATGWSPKISVEESLDFLMHEVRTGSLN
jgi:GDP-mannose 4,6-dehydratase